ncbi:helix-turn-helix domain-containing protein [Actinoplanes sp. NBRC 103695]|uniref:helix-turn-helix domain-containing protein n=1 Tax=Actinoplanes sp. NBRC 103695 TaxID=3032202 RepID=UPI0025541C80|nr:helix-turn-helix domain-containing protein [Actinoplanes sp. NBRC 103695]
MFTDIESFQQALAATGLAPVLGGRHDEAEFRAGVAARDFGSLRLIELVTPAGECFRTARIARAVDEELWQIELMTRGRARVEQGSGSADLGPADLVLVDPARPVRFASTASRHVSVLVPRRELRLRPRDAERLVGVGIRGDRGPAALVSALINALPRSRVVGGGLAERSAGAVIELISVALEEQLGGVSPDTDEALRRRVVGFIEARLSERELGPAFIARAHHISVRRLHKLFESEPLTVAATIRRRRLERCRAELVRGDRTVTAVAARWGFTDPAHFSRLFKATYGYNAAALRSSNRARTVNAPAGRRDEDGGAHNGER